MTVHLDGNVAKARDFEKPLAEFTKHGKFVLKSVRENRAFDRASNKVLDSVESVTYTIVDPETFANLKVKVANPTPVITQGELDQTDSPVFIIFPLDKTLVRPYAIEYGKVKVSIIAPSAELVADSKK